MEYTYKKMKNLFLRQSYLDSWADYEKSLEESGFIRWDYVILTASNEEQAESYREQIQERCREGQLPEKVHYAVLADPEGKRVGSGGATFNVLRYIAEREDRDAPFAGLRILVIHSGGDSKRIPQYSVTGKLFSPVPRQLPDGRCSTLFDEFMIGMSAVPSRFREGMLVLSGDVLLLFNPLQIDGTFYGAAAISIRESVQTGKDHGVFLSDEQGDVKCFLHKQPEERLWKMGAVNDQGCVDLDTGAVLFDCHILNALYGLISTNGRPDEKKAGFFINEEARISFYGDFLYPLAKQATLEQYYEEAAEGSQNQKLHDCRTLIWEALHRYPMKLIRLSPAQFIHFGTTRELLQLVTKEVEDYEFLDWKKQIRYQKISSSKCPGTEAAGEVSGEIPPGASEETAEEANRFAAHNACVEEASVGRNAYLENCYIGADAGVGNGSIVSNLYLSGQSVPDGCVFHGLILKDSGKYVVRVYGVEDNPKGVYDGTGTFLGISLKEFVDKNRLSPEVLWKKEEMTLWDARLYPACTTQKQALEYAEILCRMAKGKASPEEIQTWEKEDRTSLHSGFYLADAAKCSAFVRELEIRILAERFTALLQSGSFYRDALKVFGKRGITEPILACLNEKAKKLPPLWACRVEYAVSRFMKEEHCLLDEQGYDVPEARCFGRMKQMIYEDAVIRLPDLKTARIAYREVKVSLPVRVNWGGGWTDTPPFCIEHGGTVLNAAIKLRGILPVEICVRRLDQLHIEYESQDVGVSGSAETVEEIRNCTNPYDSFALHKAALIACGIIPMQGTETLQDILKRLGGGIYLSTQVKGVPKGSGLGTSSILSAACVKGLFAFLGRELTDNGIYETVLCMEQIMSTGGGWQDQAGGLTGGVKWITSQPGLHQQLTVEKVRLSEETKIKLQERFALIYTGQRRLARNLLREVVGSYIGACPQALDALQKMPALARSMRQSLEQGDIDRFAQLLNEHWLLSRQLDSGSTNTCIDQMFLACEDLTCGRFIAGAGGGGFLQVILKEGVTKKQLAERLYRIFQGSGGEVWDCEILFDDCLEDSLQRSI